MTETCDRYLADLVAYADGELRAARKEVVEAHLQVCPGCLRRIAEFTEVDRLIQASSPARSATSECAALKLRLAQAAHDRSHSWWRRIRAWHCCL